MRFNPPPNWPPPPPGWVPESTWTPDPSWPPPPPGWQFWVDDGWPQVPPGYRPPWPPQPSPRPASRNALWIALAAAAAVIVVVASVLAVVGLRGGSLSAAEQTGSRKADITQLTRDLLVDKAAFPDFSGGKRRSGLGGNDRKAEGRSDLSINPQECAEFYGYSRSATQTAFATVSKMDSDGPSSLEVHLAITPDRANLQDILQNCQAFTVSLELLGRTVTFDAELEPLEASGVPPWAVGAVMKSSSSPFPGIPISMSVTTATISGYYRGVLVIAGYDVFNRRSKDIDSIDTDSVDDLVKLFDAQIEKLEAAP